MFENVEKKLKTYATVNFVGVIIVALSLLFIGAVEFEDASGGAVLVLFLAYALIVYCLLASCWFIQAFAEITESVKQIANSTKQTNEILQTAFAGNISEEKKKAHKLLLAEAEAARIAAEKKAEAERIAAEKKAEAERIAAEKKAEAERILAEEKRALAEEKARRHKAYWAEHTEERSALLAKRREAEEALKTVGSLAGKERDQLQKLISGIDEELNKER